MDNRKGQTTQWPIEKVQKTNNDLQIITQKTKDRATRNWGRTTMS